MGTIGGPEGVEAPVTADAADRAKVEDAEEPVPDRAVRVMEGFGVAVGTDFSVGEHTYLSALVCPKSKFGLNCFYESECNCFRFTPKMGMKDHCAEVSFCCC
jgi:hypothetical protein